MTAAGGLPPNQSGIPSGQGIPPGMIPNQGVVPSGFQQPGAPGGQPQPKVEAQTAELISFD